MRHIFVFLCALLAGATTLAAAKRAELGERLDAVVDEDAGARTLGMRLAQWLDHSRFQKVNWYNY